MLVLRRSLIGLWGDLPRMLWWRIILQLPFAIFMVWLIHLVGLLTYLGGSLFASSMFFWLWSLGFRLLIELIDRLAHQGYSQMDRARERVLRIMSGPRESWYTLDLMGIAEVRPSLIYPTLAWAERQGLVASHWEDPDPSSEHRRLLYRLTDDGREWLASFSQTA